MNSRHSNYTERAIIFQAGNVFIIVTSVTSYRMHTFFFFPNIFISDQHATSFDKWPLLRCPWTIYGYRYLAFLLLIYFVQRKNCILHSGTVAWTACGKPHHILSNPQFYSEQTATNDIIQPSKQGFMYQGFPKVLSQQWREAAAPYFLFAFDLLSSIGPWCSLDCFHPVLKWTWQFFLEF